MKVMLCSSMTPEEARSIVAKGNHIVEPKLDGCRAYIIDGNLYNRRGDIINDKFPEFEGLKDIKGTFDGEIICDGGDFSTVASRVHTKDKLMRSVLSKKFPATFVCFDMVLPSLLMERKVRLENASLPSWVRKIKYSEDFDAMWSDVLANGKEGVVLKRKDSLYQEGVRSPDFIKVKSWSETIATFTELEEQPRGVTITTDDGRRVVVNGSQADGVRDAMKENGSIRAEIQYMSQKDSDAWRFPSFRSVIE